MKYSVFVITILYFTFSQVLYASKSKCTDKYIILEEIMFELNDGIALTSYKPVMTNNIDWFGLKNQSQDAYDEIRGYSDCIIEIFDCIGIETEYCRQLNNTNHTGSHEFFISTINYIDHINPLITYTTKSPDLEAEPVTISYNITTNTTKNNDEFNHINKTTKNNFNNEYSVDVFVKDSNCTKNVTNTHCNDDELETTTLILDCEDIESDECEVQATGNDTISDTSKSPIFNETVTNNTTDNVHNIITIPEDFSVILVYQNKQCTNEYNGSALDVTSHCHKITNLHDGTFSLVCSFIKDCNEESVSSNMSREKEKRNKLVLYIGVAAAAGGIIVLAIIAKFVTKLQSGAFHVPDNPNYTHPEFRDDVLEESPC